MRTLLILAAAAAVLLSAPARAQDAPADTTAPPAPRVLPEKGTWSLSFLAPGYTGYETAELGVWEMVGSRTNLGFTLEVMVSGRDRDTDGEETTDAVTSVGLGFNARRYLATTRAVAPYLHGRVFGRGFYGGVDSGSSESTTRGAHAGADAGIGAEWFPLRNFSLSGHTGVRLMVTRSRSEATAIDGTEHETTHDEGQFQTFTSTLAVRIYF